MTTTARNDLTEQLAAALAHHSWCWIDRGECTCATNRREDAERLLPLIARLQREAAIDEIEAFARDLRVARTRGGNSVGSYRLAGILADARATALRVLP